MGKILSKQNRRKMSETQPKTRADCNCSKNRTCVLNGKCNLEGVIYSAKVTRTDTNESEIYTRHWKKEDPKT